MNSIFKVQHVLIQLVCPKELFTLVALESKSMEILWVIVMFIQVYQMDVGVQEIFYFGILVVVLG